MLIIFGWMRRFTVLGIKIDECQSCGNVCEHVVGRKTNWGTLFFIPLLFLGFSHGMICSTCAAWSPLRWQDVRSGMKTGRLPLDRPRPHAPALFAAVAAEDGVPPPSPGTASDVFDRLVVNPKRGPWDMYLKAWPVAIALLMVVGAVAPKSSASPVSGPSGFGTAHQCWETTSGTVSACRMLDGSVDGPVTGKPITCYFYEPLPAGDTTLSCRD